MPKKRSTKVTPGPSNTGSEIPSTSLKYLIPKRLQLIISPHKRKGAKKAPRKTPRIKGKQSSLNFVDFPLDIVYEIANYLHPRDLLNLARLSKDFHGFFLSRSTAYVWRRALNEVKLPPCPEDLCEPEYASLIFDAFCMACGSTRASLTTDYCLRLRLCAACTKLNICSGRTFMNSENSELDEAITLVPAGTKNIGYGKDNDSYSTTMNIPKLTYFRPELQAVHDGMLEMDVKEIYAFSVAQIEIATRMMHEGFALESWEKAMAIEKEKEIQNMIARRATRLKEEMIKIGWEEKYFPSYRAAEDWDDHYAWSKLMSVPAEFTRDEWDRIFPALETLYHVSKTKKQVKEVLERALLRYIQFRSEHPPETKRLMPGARDFVEGDNFFSSFIIENREDCSDEKLDALMSEIVANTQDFLPKVENSLVDMILRRDPSQPRDREILNRAANLFLCGCRKCWQIRENMNLKVVKPYAEVIDHVLGTDDLESGVIGWTGHKICVDPLVLQAGRDILEVLGLPPDSTRDEVAKLGKLECRCGHHGYSDVALTFEQLAEHIFQERKWNERMERRVIKKHKHLIPELLQDGHSLEYLKTLIGIAPPDMEAFDEATFYAQERDIWGRVVPTVYPPDLPCPHYCRTCYRMTFLAWPYQDGAAHYHVKTKHGRDRQDDDFASVDDLVDEYGGNNWHDRLASGCMMPLYTFED